jgi:hypothetical protein
MPEPLPTPQVPPGFPLCTAPAPSAPQIIAAGGQTAPYIEAGSHTAPYTEVGGPTAPFGGLTTWGPSVAPAASPGVGPPPRA